MLAFAARTVAVYPAVNWTALSDTGLAAKTEILLRVLAAPETLLQVVPPSVTLDHLTT
uniref:Uncharacterized protein n=1 Tax=Mus spicilegus TaxID=10103 RepID=A0A8C6G5G9_MUSSI